MKRAWYLLIVPLVLASCAPVPTHESVATNTSTVIKLQPTFTVVQATATSTSLPATLVSPTSTPESCDPLQADYCITDGYFIFRRPFDAPANTFVDPSYRYGSTDNGTREPHHGVEFVNKFGTPIHAAGAGVVIFAGPDSQPLYSLWPNFYGNLIVIQHENDLYTLYAHLSKVDVVVNQSVVPGETIGEVGQSGAAIGSHLHFEVRRGNAADYYATENPELWLFPNLAENGQFLGALKISIQDENGKLVSPVEITLQRYDQNRQIGTTLYIPAYAKTLLVGDENVGLSDLSAGKYRIAMEYNGQWRERWVEVQSGRLTQVVLTVK